jgi:hypothetical protein
MKIEVDIVYIVGLSLCHQGFISWCRPTRGGWTYFAWEVRALSDIMCFGVDYVKLGELCCMRYFVVVTHPRYSLI